MTNNQYGTQRKWTDADTAAIEEMYGTCSIDQMAEYLDRTRGAVKLRIVKLRKAGILIQDPNFQRKNPFTLCEGSILLAKTCLSCGFLLPSNCYWKVRKDKDHIYMHICKNCCGKRNKNRSDDQYRANKERFAVLQEASLATSNNSGLPWGSLEENCLKDLSKSSLQLALELGRTYFGIVNRRHVLGLRRLGDTRTVPSESWTIHFPEAMVKLQEHFRKLGIPESEWMWND